MRQVRRWFGRTSAAGPAADAGARIWLPVLGTASPRPIGVLELSGPEADRTLWRQRPRDVILTLPPAGECPVGPLWTAVQLAEQSRAWLTVVTMTCTSALYLPGTELSELHRMVRETEREILRELERELGPLLPGGWRLLALPAPSPSGLVALAGDPRRTVVVEGYAGTGRQGRRRARTARCLAARWGVTVYRPDRAGAFPDCLPRS